MGDKDGVKYGIVVDSGSSGSRLQIYRWEDPRELQKHSKDEAVLNSVPKLIQQEDWAYKTTPGMSSFEDKPEKIWDDHFKHLVKYAEKIVPKDKQAETPFFVLATAGMRLVPEEKRFKILNNVCTGINSKSHFRIPDCQNYVQVIDGEVEGLYGWIGLNYLMGQFNNYDSAHHTSFGFMDMGGASTQIAFVPSDEKEIEKHADDLYTVSLRNVNGGNQDWKVFVSTWLGFGANQARKRHLRNTITSLPDNVDTKEEYEQYLVDPCTPKDATIDFNYQGKSYKIKGLGNYEHCLKGIYPLLAKHLPCKDDPCLFNGVHAPAIDFEKDKFVGISEYWYTANDVFDMGGEYSFLKFNEKVKEFCGDDWDNVMKNFKNGKYGKNMKLEYLKDSCFKASWVINVLHEGFGLPRIGLETDYLSEDKVEAVKNEPVHVPFQSANLIEGAELSWTLGKMLLYASSEIEPISGTSQVGITSSDTSVSLGSEKFVPANVFEGKGLEVSESPSVEVRNMYVIGSDRRSKSSGVSFFFFLVFVAFVALSVTRSGLAKRYLNMKTVNKVMSNQLVQKIRLQARTFYYTKLASQETCDIRETNLALSSIEEGQLDDYSGYQSKVAQGKGIRTRSSLLNLHSAPGNAKPPLMNTGSTSSIGSLLDYQKTYQNGNFSKGNSGTNTPNGATVASNNSVLDFNKLRSSITNNGAQLDVRRNASTSKLQID